MSVDAVPASSLRSVMAIFFALIFTFMVYLVFVSNWYWNCAAQIEIETLAPVACPLPQEVAKAPAAQPDANDENALWPEFGKYNDVYEDLGAFWGTDIVSEFLKSLGQSIGNYFTRERTEAFANGWNDTMKPLDNRKLVFDVLGAAMAVLLGLVLTDLYGHMTRPKRTPAG